MLYELHCLCVLCVCVSVCVLLFNMCLNVSFVISWDDVWFAFVLFVLRLGAFVCDLKGVFVVCDLLRVSVWYVCVVVIVLCVCVCLRVFACACN